MSDGREIVKPPKEKPDYSEWKFEPRQVFALERSASIRGEVAHERKPILITQVGGDASMRARGGDGTVKYRFIKADGSLGAEHWIYGYELQKALTEGNAIVLDGARTRTIVDLPPEWAAQVAAQADAQEKARKSRMERGLDPLHDKEPESHPSYGTITLTRGSSTGRTLFGSAFKHHTTISIDICRATLNRSLSKDRHFSGADIVRIEMSEAQFAHFITSVAVGEGTPCTLSYVFGERMPEPPAPRETEKFHEDARRTMKVAAQHVTDAIAKARALIEKPGTVTKTDRKDILESLFHVEKSLNDSLPFTVKQFGEHMEKIVADGKHEIDAYLTRLATRAGVALPAPITMPALTDGDEDGIRHAGDAKGAPLCGDGLDRGDSVLMGDPTDTTCAACCVILRRPR